MALTSDVPAAADDTLSQSAEGLRLALEVLGADQASINWERVADILDQPEAGLDVLRHALNCGTAALTQRFLDGENAGTLVRQRARLVDMLVLAAWKNTAADSLKKSALIAVGGYGRGELHPQSDVDLLILLKSNRKGSIKDPVSHFLALLWDIGLEVGHSTRTVQECGNEARQDITIVTNLMESRCLAGPESLFQAMRQAVAPDKI